MTLNRKRSLLGKESGLACLAILARRVFVPSCLTCLCIAQIVHPPLAHAQTTFLRDPVLEAAVDIELEGPITNIENRGATTQIQILGVFVTIDDATEIKTPSARITRSDLIGPPLPGRSVPGFLYGTGIVLGKTTRGIVHADILLVEPSEGVLAGPWTAVPEHDASILRVPIVILDDPRMPGIAMNELGFEIDPNTIEVGSFAVASGYLGEDGIFYAHFVEGDGAIVGSQNQTSITRAKCTLSENVDIRGGSTSPTGTVTLFDDETGEFLTRVDVEPDEDLVGLGTYRFDLQLSHCPRRVRVENSNNSTAVADIDH